MGESQLADLLSAAQDTAAQALAARYAPIIRFDNHEPFLPLVAGYTVFDRSGTSPSFRQGHTIDLVSDNGPAAKLAIEYAIWWDWDIGHLYELEHVWVFVDADGCIVRGEASWHGDQHDMRLEGRLTLDGDHLVVFSEPGKHAFAPTPQWFQERRKAFKRSETNELAGASGVLVTPYTRDDVKKTPVADLLARSYLAQHAFEPSWTFDKLFRFSPVTLVPWPALRTWMPSRVNHWLSKLAHEIEPRHYRFWRIGHRGARSYAPDNSLSSFRKAAELGADLVELDVQCTADKRIAVIHDSHLTREDGSILSVHQSTLAEVKTVDLGGGERVPTLQEALDVCQQENVGVYVEIKDGSTVPGLVEVIRAHDWGEHCLCGSFRPDWLADLKSLAPEVPTSVLFGSPNVDAVKLAQSIGADYVHPCWERFDRPSTLLTPEWMADVREAGLGVICWHEERPDVIAALRQVGVDGICSDAPELLLNGRPYAS